MDRATRKFGKSQNNFRENKHISLGWNIFIISYLIISIFAFTGAIFYFIVSRQNQNVFNANGDVISSFKLAEGISSRDAFYLMIVILDFAYTIFVIGYYFKNKGISQRGFVIMLVGRLISIAYMFYHAGVNLDMKENYPHSITQQVNGIDLGIITDGQTIEIHYSGQFELVRNIAYIQFSVAGFGLASIIGAFVLTHVGNKNSGTYYV